jgi:hypothetical protein
MAANLERFKNDLDRLIHQAKKLDYAMVELMKGEEFVQQVRQMVGEEKAEAFLTVTRPSFRVARNLSGELSEPLRKIRFVAIPASHRYVDTAPARAIDSSTQRCGAIDGRVQLKPTTDRRSVIR